MQNANVTNKTDNIEPIYWYSIDWKEVNNLCRRIFRASADGIAGVIVKHIALSEKIIDIIS